MVSSPISGALAFGESSAPTGSVAIAETVAATLLGNYSANAPVLLMLGSFKFSLNSAVFQELNRTTEAAWGNVPRIGQYNALQFTGPGSDTIELPGVIYPKAFGYAETLDQLREMMMSGNTFRLILGDGRILGLWAILSVREAKSNFGSDTAARRVEFTVTLAKYADI